MKMLGQPNALARVVKAKLLMLKRRPLLRQRMLLAHPFLRGRRSSSTRRRQQPARRAGEVGRIGLMRTRVSTYADVTYTSSLPCVHDRIVSEAACSTRR